MQVTSQNTAKNRKAWQADIFSPSSSPRLVPLPSPSLPLPPSFSLLPLTLTNVTLPLVGPGINAVMDRSMDLYSLFFRRAICSCCVTLLLFFCFACCESCSERTVFMMSRLRRDSFP